MVSSLGFEKEQQVSFCYEFLNCFGFFPLRRTAMWKWQDYFLIVELR